MSNTSAAFLAFILVAMIGAIAGLFSITHRILKITRLLIKSQNECGKILESHEDSLTSISNEIPIFNKPERAAEIFRQNEALRIIVKAKDPQ